MISKFLQILCLQPRISKVFLDLTVGQKIFVNKIPFINKTRITLKSYTEIKLSFIHTSYNLIINSAFSNKNSHCPYMHQTVRRKRIIAVLLNFHVPKGFKSFMLRLNLISLSFISSPTNMGYELGLFFIVIYLI